MYVCVRARARAWVCECVGGGWYVSAGRWMWVGGRVWGEAWKLTVLALAPKQLPPPTPKPQLKVRLTVGGKFGFQWAVRRVGKRWGGGACDWHQIAVQMETPHEDVTKRFARSATLLEWIHLPAMVPGSKHSRGCGLGSQPGRRCEPKEGLTSRACSFGRRGVFSCFI